MLRGRAGGNVGDLVVLNGEVFKALDGGIGDTVAADGVFQGFVFTGQASIFVGEAIGVDGTFQAIEPLIHFTAAHLPTKVLKVVCHNDTPLPMG